jgi:hypothetical protein
MPMHPRRTWYRRPFLPLAALIAATLVGSPLSAQTAAPAGAAPYKPTQFFGAGASSLSVNGNSSTWYNLLFGLGYKKVYFTVNFNLHSDADVGASANDYRLGYLLMHKQPHPKGGAMGLALTGGLWHPDQGDMSPMAAVDLFGALGKSSRFMANITFGQIFPEGGDGVTVLRPGLVFAF